MNNEITICLTSCSRFDLLEQTVKSLIANWDGPKPKEFLIYEDSDLEDLNLLVNLNWLESLVTPDFCPSRFFLGITGKVGQIAACDALMSEVKTEYVFWTEDDVFFHTPGFISKSLDILENDPKIITPWIRDVKDMNRHPPEGKILSTPSGTKYRMLRTGFKGMWHGFAFYAGLRRKSDYDLLGSYSKFINGNSLDTESNIGLQYKNLGFRAVTLLDGYCTHLGKSRSLPK